MEIWGLLHSFQKAVICDINNYGVGYWKFFKNLAPTFWYVAQLSQSKIGMHG